MSSFLKCSLFLENELVLEMNHGIYPHSGDRLLGLPEKTHELKIPAAPALLGGISASTRSIQHGSWPMAVQAAMLRQVGIDLNVVP